MGRRGDWVGVGPEQSFTMEFVNFGSMDSVSQKQPVGGDEDGQNGMAISGLARDFRG
jgi:hypothetical protein